MVDFKTVSKSNFHLALTSYRLPPSSLSIKTNHSNLLQSFSQRQLHMSRCLLKALPQSLVVVFRIRLFSRSLSTVYKDRKADYANARKWASNLNKDTIPRSIARVRFDRSSGKGGQYINK